MFFWSKITGSIRKFLWGDLSPCPGMLVTTRTMIFRDFSEIYVGLCKPWSAWQAEWSARKLCWCWVLSDNKGHCTHQYVVQDYVGEKKWTADQPLPAARVATAERDSSVEPPKRRRQWVASIHFQNSFDERHGVLCRRHGTVRRKRCLEFLGIPKQSSSFGPLESWEGGGWTTPNLCLTTETSSTRHPFFLFLLLPASWYCLEEFLLIVNSWHRQDVTKDVKRRMKLGGGNSNIFLFSSLLGKDDPILANIFQRGWFNHQLGNHPKRLEPGVVFTLDGWMVSRSTCWRRSSRRPRRCWCHQWNLYQVRNFRKKKSWKPGGPYSQVNHVNLPGCMGVSGFSLDVPLEVSKWLGSVGYFTYL